MARGHQSEHHITDSAREAIIDAHKKAALTGAPLQVGWMIFYPVNGSVRDRISVGSSTGIGSTRGFKSTRRCRV